MIVDSEDILPMFVIIVYRFTEAGLLFLNALSSRYFIFRLIAIMFIYVYL